MQQRTCRWRRHSEPFLHHMPSSLSPAWPRSRPTGSSTLEPTVLPQARNTCRYEYRGGDVVIDKSN